MKPISLILTIVAATFAAPPSVRADAPAPAEAPSPPAKTPEAVPGSATPAGGKRGALMKRFDTDGNGLLSPEERMAAGENARNKMLERFDEDGDGKLSASERQAAEADREARMLSRFDADGDGKLSAEERQKALQAQPGQGPAAVVPKGPAQGVGKPLKREGRPKLLQRFDKDGDGQLSDTERAAARAALQARKAAKAPR